MREIKQLIFKGSCETEGNAMKKISIVVPCYNEQEVLPLFYIEIQKVMEQIQSEHGDTDFELLFINDGSRDGTLVKLRELAKQDERVRYTTQYYDTNFTNERDGNLLISLDNVEPVSWYLVFMGGDEKITHVKTDVTNKRTLVIVKDSYGNALVPYLTQSFSDIYVIDMRYFDLNAVSFMQQVGATDVLFAMNTFSATGGNSECLETIRTQ